ncbi:MAG: hypothetical protein IPJ55_17455 [Chloracidobacterium sp.]|nr:hypothetical protein [Chloracidobacterium sp.]
MSLRSDYSYSLYKVGQIFLTSLGGVPVAFFDTSVHNVATGPTYRFEGGDTLFLKYNYVAAETSGQGVSISYRAHAIVPEYVSKVIPGWLVTISAGATIVEQVQNRTYFAGKFALTTNYEKPTRLQLSLSRQAAPAFFGTGGALMSNTAQLLVTHGFSKILKLTVSGNYAYNESTPVDVFTLNPLPALHYLNTSLRGALCSASLRNIASSPYTGISTFDRHATKITLRTEWK